MNMGFVKFYIAVIVSILILSSCAHPLPECYNKSTKNVRIRWGTMYVLSGKEKGYQIDADATLWKMTLPPMSRDYQKEKLSYVDPVRYCRLTKMVLDTILKIQVLNEPGDSIRFIEYTNVDNGAEMRAMWNPDFKTANSNGFRSLYDSLQLFLKFEKNP